ncbi:hypothetical protein ACLB2K_007288 [Fragaria x ananassa]
MKYGQDISNSACLKLPSGAEWPVKLTRCNGKVWFEKGWPEFSMFFSLDYGDFLLFRYEGNSVIQVCIFDRTATEIDYPIAMLGMEETDHEDEEDDDISIEILEDSPPRPEVKREKSPLPWHSRGAAVQLEDNRNSMKVESDCSMDCGMASVNPSPFDIGNKNKGSETSGEVAERHCSFFRVPRDNLEAASKFIPKILFFRVTIRAYHLARSNVNGPANFIKKSIKRLQQKQTVMLQVKKFLWPVNLVPRTQGSAGKLCGGWITFAGEHDLKEGNVCVFELMEVEANNIVLKVHIFRCD